MAFEQTHKYIKDPKKSILRKKTNCSDLRQGLGGGLMSPRKWKGSQEVEKRM